MITTLFIRTKTIILSVLLVLSLLTPMFALSTAGAADVFSGAKKEACEGARLQSADADCSAGPGDVQKVIRNIIDLLSVIVGIICVIVIIIGGFRYITAAGDSGKIESARNTIIYALVGLVLVAFAQLIVKFILARISG